MRGVELRLGTGAFIPRRSAERPQTSAIAGKLSHRRHLATRFVFS